MLERNLSVTQLPVKNSFIYVPKNLDKLANGSCVKLTFENGNTGYFSVSNSISTLKENSIGLSSLYCKTLGIEEDELVLLSEISSVPAINSITVTPTSESDYDVIESLAENIQSTLLNQIRVVYAGQKFVIWIGNTINVTVIVDEVMPVSPGVLGFLTEVHIKPTLKYVEDPKPVSNNNFENIKKGFQNIYKKINIFQINTTKEENKFNKYLNYKHDLIYRLIKITDCPMYQNIGNYLKPFNVFTTRKSLSPVWSQNSFTSNPIYCLLSLITDDVFSNQAVYVRLLILEDFFDEVDSELNNVLFVDDNIFDHLNSDLGTRVVLKYLEKLPYVMEINIHTKRNYLLNVEEEFKKYLSEHSDEVLVLNCDFPLKFGSNIVCSLKFVPVESKFVIVDNNSIRNFKYQVVEEEVVLPVNEAKKEEILRVDNFLRDISNYSDIIMSSMVNFGNGCDRFENILIIGKPGTGKTTLVKYIAEELKSYPNFIYTKTVNCRSFRGKTPDSLIRVLSDIFSKLIIHQPSLLLLDNLHILCEHIPGDETAPNSLYYNRISEMLHNFFKLFSDPNKIGICATTQSIEKLNKNLYSSRGSHLFKNIYTIEELKKVDRYNLLQHLFKNHNVDGVNFDDISVKTEGFVIHDIVDFYNKTLFELHKEADDENNPKITQHHCDTALKNTCVLSLQNVNLHSPGDKDFLDVGGLEDVKDVLVESLLWPTKYPNIFSKAPLRLQSGLLLYGPPGTGKTLLAAAAAKHCGLRLISVKGPELLSKYIGASEQAVRDVFQKAQSVRPCILFFDEFDSLAPRRGHDNTGVTDRVVNQFLTQLDGVESLTGVCVLAATSRPDLLDPALLRPGRLDRQLLCPLPNKDGRLAILTVLAKHLDLEDNTDLEKIAVATESYSGADLQSLLYTAQISTIEGSWVNEQFMDEISESKITQKHLEDALAKTKPSLTKQERLKYERIYAKFTSGSNLDDFKAGTRATLA